MIEINFSFYGNESLFILDHEEDIIFGFRIVSYRVKVFLTVLLGIILIFGVIGNVATCVVVAHDRTMRTPTNLYLLNLAITDLLTTLYVPVTLYMIFKPLKYPMGELGCRIQFGLWDIVSCCSVLTIVAFTVERYLVVSKPFLRQKLASNSRVYKIIAMNWLVSVLCSIPEMVLTKFVIKNEFAYCSLAINDGFKIMQPLGNIIFFVIPMTIISVLYIMIAIKLKTRQKTLRSESVLQNQNADKAVKMLVAIAAFFFICWAPDSIVRLSFLMSKHFILKYYNFTSSSNFIFTVAIAAFFFICLAPYSIVRLSFLMSKHFILKYYNFTSSSNFIFTVAIAAFFFICWAPYSIVRLSFLMSKHFILKYYNIWQIMCCVCCINICMSTVINPILYGLMSRKFRKAFKDILKRRNSSRSMQNGSSLQQRTL